MRPTRAPGAIPTWEIGSTTGCQISLFVRRFRRRGEVHRRNGVGAGWRVGNVSVVGPGVETCVCVCVCRGESEYRFIFWVFVLFLPQFGNIGDEETEVEKKPAQMTHRDFLYRRDSFFPNK